MRFRKRPVVVEAVQFDPYAAHRTSLPAGVSVIDTVGNADNYGYLGLIFFVVTIHGQKTTVQPGDWIITEPDGIHHYPCKPDVFEATYEAVQ